MARQVSSYIAEVATCVIEEGGKSRELKKIIGPILEEELSGDDQLTAICHEIIVAVCPEGDTDGGEEDIDYLVDCRNIILAYAGKQLLKPTHLQLRRNGTFGVVGNNGVGKTTLLNRIASREINGFPMDIRVLYIQHEVYVDLECTVGEFMQMQAKEGAKPEAIKAGLEKVGFNEEKMNASVNELSGGWRMKLAIATAVTQKCDLLLLDEPTNHLDVASVQWLKDYIVSLTDTTICIVSHDYDFLRKTCTDVMHICDLQLKFYQGGFENFAKVRPDVVEALPTVTESGASALIVLPDPGKLDGVKSRSKPILEMRNLTFCYPGAAKPQLTDVNVKMCVTSRVALLGVNGSGKTTLLRTLVGDMSHDQGTGLEVGEIVKHHNLRISYIAQHSMYHLEDHLKMSPVAYVQDRFHTGQDKELSKMETMKVTAEEEVLMTKKGNICEIVGRAIRGGELSYETKRSGYEEKETFWEAIGGLKRKDPYVMKMVLNYDAKMQALQSGMEVRPCTEKEILKHLADFGISHRLAQSGRIKGMSGGQKCRLVLAAAVWTCPHVIALDEPTNYLDNETLNALTVALQKFKGAILVISHHAEFVNAITTEKWMVESGKVSIAQTAKEGKMMKSDSKKTMDRSDSQESIDSYGMEGGASSTSLASLKE